MSDVKRVKRYIIFWAFLKLDYTTFLVLYKLGDLKVWIDPATPFGWGDNRRIVCSLVALTGCITKAGDHCLSN